MTTQPNLRALVAAVNAVEAANSALLPQVTSARQICSFEGARFYAVDGVRFGAVTAFSFHAAVETLCDGGIIVWAAGTASGAEALCYSLCDQHRADAALNAEVV